jgi:hypothetical protein
MDADFRQANRLRRIRQLTGSLAMKKLLLAAMFSALASAAFAADVPAPVYKAPPPTVVLGSGFYASIDGSWQQVNLPDYALGFHVLTAPPTNDAGTLSLRQRLDGYVVHGTLGYFLPHPENDFWCQHAPGNWRALWPCFGLGEWNDRKRRPQQHCNKAESGRHGPQRRVRL